MNLPKLIFSSFFFITAFSAWSKPASAEKPNIIFILADDMGIDSVSANNEAMGPLKTPNIDRLISQGMNFTDAHSGFGRVHSYPLRSAHRAVLLAHSSEKGSALGLGESSD